MGTALGRLVPTPEPSGSRPSLWPREDLCAVARSANAEGRGRGRPRSWRGKRTSTQLVHRYSALGPALDWQAVAPLPQDGGGVKVTRMPLTGPPAASVNRIEPRQSLVSFTILKTTTLKPAFNSSPLTSSWSGSKGLACSYR